MVVTHCRVDPSDPETCMEPPQDYEERGGPIQAVVHPIPPPSISSVSPSVAVVGTFVEVHGAHFGTSGTLTFNGAEAAGYDLLDWTSTRIQAFVPGGATSGPVVVATGGQSSNGVALVVMPHIDLLTPGSGTVGQSVTITGTGFGSSGAVTFNGVAATTVPSWTSTSVTVLVPSGATSGNVVVTVGGVPSTGKFFSVTSGSPTITETIQYYHTDALGSVRLITDAGGQVVATNDYLPFGDDWQPTGDLDARGFAGMERTWHTGIASWGPLNYAGARYYHSQTGRFTSPDDSIYIDPLNPQTWNLYAYVMNNPLRWVDPTGRCVETNSNACVYGEFSPAMLEAIANAHAVKIDLGSFMHGDPILESESHGVSVAAATTVAASNPEPHQSSRALRAVRSNVIGYIAGALADRAPCGSVNKGLALTASAGFHAFGTYQAIAYTAGAVAILVSLPVSAPVGAVALATGAVVGGAVYSVFSVHAFSQEAVGAVHAFRGSCG